MAAEAVEPQTQEGAPNDQDKDNKFQQAIASWRSIDLSSLVSTLDSAAADLLTHQRDSLVQRKDLAQKTKDFRKLEDAGKLAEIKGMLKAYQSFIDTISTHSKSVQTAFLQIYSPLSEAPDPYPLLEASLDSIVTATEVVPKLESENKHLQSTVSKLTGQLEDAEAQLQQERATRQSSQTGQDARIKEIQDSWNAVLREKQDNWDAREKSLEEKVENQERLLKELKANYEVSARMGRAEDDATSTSTALGASQQELDIVNAELDKANLRLADVESRNEQLRLHLAESTAKQGPSQPHISVQDDAQFLRLRSENSQLLRKLDAQRYEKASEKGKWDTTIRSLEREVTSLKQDRESIKKKLDKCSDYDEVKQELDMLKSIEFATGDGDDSDHEQGEKSSESESLEKLLLARNKKLSNDLTVLRVSHNDLQSRLDSLQQDLDTTTKDLENSRSLTQTLEDDLLRTQQEASNAFDPSAMSVAGTYTSRYPKSSYAASRRGGSTSPTSSIISGFETGTSSPRGLDSLRSEPSSAILPMVTAQRDRFKTKISNLETTLAEQYTLVSSLRSEVASLQKDNLALYEKSRYVNSYNRGGATTAYQNTNPSTVTIDRGSANTDTRYRSAYESSISPFAAFRGRESARAFQRLSLPERGVLQASRLVLATRMSRNLFAVYCVGLHCLIFVMLFWMGGSESSRLGESVGAAAVAAAAGAGSGKVKDATAAVGQKWEQPGFGDTS